MKYNLLYGRFDPKIKFSYPSRPSYADCLAFFRAYLGHIPFISKNDIAEIHKYWEYFSLSKNESIVVPGQVCQYVVFICKGAVKYYTEDELGKHIIAFGIKSHFITALPSFTYAVESRDGLVCAENTFGLKISLANLHRLMEDYPAFKEFYDEISGHGIMRMVKRVKAFQAYDAKGRYKILMQQNPAVFHHFSMQDISNYLGIKPETLSRLRRDKELLNE